MAAWSRLRVGAPLKPAQPPNPTQTPPGDFANGPFQLRDIHTKFVIYPNFAQSRLANTQHNTGLLHRRVSLLRGSLLTGSFWRRLATFL